MRRRASGAVDSRSIVRRLAPVGACAVLCLLLAHCSSSGIGSRWGVAASPRVIPPGEPVPKGGGTRMVGTPYVVGGRLYVPRYNPRYKAVGLASWYGEDFYGRYTANGEIFDLNAISAASPTMPLPSYARVTNLNNGRSLIVRVNDRGPYVGNRIVDVSVRAAKLLGFYRQGTAMVKVQYVGRAPLRGSSNRILAATLREDEPAPLPSQVRLAEGPIFPPAPPPPSNVLASAGNEYPLSSVPAAGSLSDPPPAQPVSYPLSVHSASGQLSYADPAGMDGTAQVLNGRGLY